MTTIAAVRKDGVTALAGDGQVTLGEKVIMKGNAQKVRRIYHDQVVIGFAGGVADAFTLQDWFEKKLDLNFQVKCNDDNEFLIVV
ncbi:MAG: hypothetical protein ABF585_00005, partial [Lacticaseibacillus paracasei]